MGAGPDLYPQRLDPLEERAWLIRLSRGQYEAASFLDDRVLAPGMPAQWADLAELRADCAGLSERCAFIFHIGHVGSTLLSRLLGAFPGVHALREPAPLQDLARIHGQLNQPESLWSPERFEEHLGLFLKLWSRTYEPGQLSVIKATSWASNLAAPLLARPSKPSAVMMTVRPEVYLAGILASAGGLADALGSAPAALARLHGRLDVRPWTLHAMSPGERVAMVWACEMAALEAAARAAPQQVFWLDFQEFLARPAEGLAAALAHLGQTVERARIESVAQGSLMTRYSKQPEHAFSAARRQAVLSESRRTHGMEIRRGLDWLEAAQARFPQVRILAEAVPAWRNTTVSAA